MPLDERESDGPWWHYRTMIRDARRRMLVSGFSLTAITILAIFLRLHGLEQRGLVYWDGAKFALEGVRLHAALDRLIGVHAPAGAGKGVGTAKPTHALLFALAYAIVGTHDWAALTLDAVASVVAVLLSFVIGRRLFGVVPGLIAAILLTVSPYDIIYARSALSESDATALLLAAVAVWSYTWIRPDGERETRWMPRRYPLGLIVAGVLLGLAITANYRLIVYGAVLVAFDLLWAACTARRRWPLRVLLWAPSLVAVPLAWQVAGQEALRRGVVLFAYENTGRAATYAGELQRVLAAANLTLPNPVQAEWYVQRQGIALVILLLIGLAVALRTHSFPWMAIAALAVVPAVIFASGPYVVARSLASLVPFTMLLAAAGVASIAGRSSTVRAMMAILVAVGVVSSATLAWPLTQQRSGYARAAAYLSRHGQERVLTSSEVMVFYFRGNGPTCDAPRLPKDLPHLAADIAAGYRYAVLDARAGGLIARIVRNQGTRVELYPVVSATPAGLDLVGSEESSPPANPAAGEFVELYRIANLHVPTTVRVAPNTCRRNRVGS